MNFKCVLLSLPDVAYGLWLCGMAAGNLAKPLHNEGWEGVGSCPIMKVALFLI